VEPGTGITASSMATMRPLFVAFFSRSKLFGSTTPRGNTYPRNASRLGYFRKRENTEVEELELHSDLGKSIRVTTTITNTESTRTGQNNEGRTNTSESEMALNEESQWDTIVETDSSKEVGHHTTIEGGLAV
jgi:hypothetical protein